MTTAKSVDASRPNYIVVFKEASEKNTRTMANVLKKSAAKGLSFHVEHASALEAGDSGVPTKVYETIGVATADLTAQQKTALEKREDVAVVAVNQVRYLPPVLRSQEEGAEAEPTSARKADEALEAYLMGMRDAANSALGFLGRGAGPDAPVFGPTPMASGVAAAQRVTWGIKAMGVTRIGAPTGRGVKLAVLDTGIDLNHRDLASRVAEGSTALSFVEGVSVQDIFGHGTHCAGTAAGPSRSVSGTRYAVAPGAELLVGKVFNNNMNPEAFDNDIIEGLQWADEQGARVVSLSLGSERGVDGPFAEAYEELAKQMLERSTRSLLLFAAAGNESGRPAFTRPVGNPAACPSIFAVGAVDRNMRIAPFSCRAMDGIGAVDISGPGVDVFSATTGDGFELLSGTSMATPHVAGLAALYFEANPTLSAKQVRDLMFSRAAPLGDARDFGAGFARL